MSNWIDDYYAGSSDYPRTGDSPKASELAEELGDYPGAFSTATPAEDE